MRPRGHNGMRNGFLLALGLIAILPQAQVQAAGLQEWVQSFAESEFVLARATTNVPFQPLGWLSAKNYGAAELRTPGSADASVTYQQTSLSQAGFIPLLASSRDAVVIGEWVGWTHFQVDGSGSEDFSVLSVAVPLGWMRQVSPDWQLASFVAPLGHKASSVGADWYWEGMAGVFARYARNEQVAWIFGFFADVSRDDKFYIPYVGATWIVDQRWTISAVLPWPAVLYAPTGDTFFRLGVAPSGATWSTRQDGEVVAVDLDSWDLGLSVEHRLWGNVWGRVEAGVTGFRGMSFSGNDWQPLDSPRSSKGYAGLGIAYRPAKSAQ